MQTGIGLWHWPVFLPTKDAGLNFFCVIAFSLAVP